MPIMWAIGIFLYFVYTQVALSASNIRYISVASSVTIAILAGLFIFIIFLINGKRIQNIILGSKDLNGLVFLVQSALHNLVFPLFFSLFCALIVAPSFTGRSILKLNDDTINSFIIYYLPITVILSINDIIIYNRLFNKHK